ncbi:LPS glycosyltransferase [Gregarina niphandrodes]|uniref:LPS glycosyltransferase n=1 Tax=Gregarina niphandrodes TaxID=110365 RepID=A0A023B1D6_GRENI|nr:LPS glycosyltransferase [Gregarina niphandrodes]EZG45750.1 LPS glycosyltransferase [Gregarina niphandrodes]|eukprot:XP_011132456.1 LPS glycosyltransferase [Gregarina niphandrodes]
MYVINLAHHTERAEYIRSTFSRKEHGVRFVTAVNGLDPEALYAQVSNLDDLDRLRNDGDRYTLWKTGATRGQLGNTVSLLNAMAQALEDDMEYAIIAEDDVADATKCLFPAPLSSYVAYANKHYSGWHNIRLEWGVHRPVVNLIKRYWYHQVKKRLTESALRQTPSDIPELGRTYGHWTGEEDFPILTPSTAGWGTVAVLWSRAGMQYLTSALQADADNEQHPARWTCPREYRCISDNFFWHLGPPNTTLITTPPLIGCRMAESSTAEIRGRRTNNLLTHVGITAINTHWLLETYEMLQPRRPGIDTWPPLLQYSVGNAVWS